MRARQGDEGKVPAAGTNVAADLAVTPQHDTARRHLHAGIKHVKEKGSGARGLRTSSVRQRHFRAGALLPRIRNTAEDFRPWTQFIGQAAKFNFLLMKSLIGTCGAFATSWIFCFGFNGLNGAVLQEDVNRGLNVQFPLSF